MPSFSPLESRKTLNILGINSGTSADGLDFALVRLTEGKRARQAPVRISVLITSTFPFENKVRDRIITASEAHFDNGSEWLRLDAVLGKIIGGRASQFIKKASMAGFRIDAIAMHGQTVRHLPDERPEKLTFQIGDPARVAAITSLPVISDFRRSDIAAGGEGAPLSPILHEALFRHGKRWRAIVNIGGISNATILPPKSRAMAPLAGDTGPGNMLIDSAVKLLIGRPYDVDGATAAQGKADYKVVEKAMRNPFFARRPPKSTGRELFGAEFLQDILKTMNSKQANDKLATVTELTARGIADFIERFGPRVEEIYICGGGVHNKFLMMRLASLMSGKSISSIRTLGYDPDYLEAVLWAYLAYCFIREKPISAGHFTGAKRAYISGKLCMA
jgi:anhydro-N-acetylmuramic acid kinase